MNYKTIITSKYEGWIASILLHGLLSLVFLIVIYDNPIDLTEYTDVTFSNFNPIDLMMAVTRRDFVETVEFLKKQIGDAMVINDGQRI